MDEMDRSPITIQVDEDIIDLIPRYIENRWSDIRTIEIALERGDFETVRNLGHGMKGSGGGWGMDQVGDIGQGIEEAAKAQDPDETRQWLDKLADFLERVEVIPENLWMAASLGNLGRVGSFFDDAGQLLVSRSAGSHKAGTTRLSSQMRW